MTMTHALNGTPIIGVAGWKNSGKTTLVARLVAELTRRGLRVATLKHAHHEFQIDTAETDSARHRKAGAAQVAIVSSKRIAVITELGSAAEPDFQTAIALLGPADLIIVEGYKTAPIRKIECRRVGAAKASSLADTDPNVVAIATDAPAAHATSCPKFLLDDIAGLADFALQLTAKPGQT